MVAQQQKDGNNLNIHQPGEWLNYGTYIQWCIIPLLE